MQQRTDALHSSSTQKRRYQDRTMAERTPRNDNQVSERHLEGVTCDAGPTEGAQSSNSSSKFLRLLRDIMKLWEEGADKEDLHGTLVTALQGLDRSLSPVVLEACCTAYEHVEALLSKPRNVFHRIKMGSDPFLALLSPTDSGFFRTVHSGPRAIQYLHLPPGPGLPDNVVQIPDRSSEEFIPAMAHEHLLQSVSRFIRKGYRLERTTESLFHEIKLRKRELMLILSCTNTITVRDVEGEEGSVFIAGRVSRSTIEAIATVLDVTFDPNDIDGVFQTRQSGSTSVYENAKGNYSPVAFLESQSAF